MSQKNVTKLRNVKMPSATKDSPSLEDRFNESLDTIKKILEAQIKVDAQVTKRIELRQFVANWFIKSETPENDIKKLTSLAVKLNKEAHENALAIFSTLTLSDFFVDEFVDPLERLITDDVEDDFELFQTAIVLKAVAEYDKHIWNLYSLVKEDKENSGEKK